MMPAESVWVVMPSHRPRLGETRLALRALGLGATRVVVPSGGTEPLEWDDVEAVVVRDNRPDVNLSRWWNIGLGIVARLAVEPYEVLVLNSDVAVTPEAIDLMRHALRTNDLSMVGPNLHSDISQVMPLGRRRTVTERIPDSCFMVRGEDNLRCDERFRWWYGHDDLEMQARHRAPVALIGGLDVAVGRPDTPLTSEQERWATEDRALYVSKWNKEPW